VTMPGSAPPTTRSLAAGRLSVADVIFYVWSATTPLTVIALVVITGFAATGLTGMPLAFLVIGAILLLFAPGFVAMARRAGNSGALYTYVSRGIGRPPGIGAAWVALLSYNALQIALYGGIGAAATPVLDWFGITASWWVVALVCWALVGTLGVLRVELNGKILAVLLIAEVALIVVYSAANLAHPDGGHVTFDTLSPGTLFVAGGGPVLALGFLGFVGFESSVALSEETKDPRRTVARATYLSVGLIAVVYALASWAITVAIGPDKVVAVSAEQGPDALFNLARTNLGETAVTIGQALFVTSVVAAMISFHTTVARYGYALGRDKVLPAVFGRTSARTQAPLVASVAQSALAVLVIVGYAVAGWDPTIQLFFWAGTSGGIGVLLLLLTSSVAVVAYFLRHPTDESIWRRLTAPALASVALLGVAFLVLSNIAGLFGVGSDHPLTWVVPTAFAAAAVLGVGYGLLLKTTRPQVYAAVGLGADVTAAQQQLPATPVGPHSAGILREDVHP
jgi:amino acid transporter